MQARLLKLFSQQHLASCCCCFRWNPLWFASEPPNHLNTTPGRTKLYLARRVSSLISSNSLLSSFRSHSYEIKFQHSLEADGEPKVLSEIEFYGTNNQNVPEQRKNQRGTISMIKFNCDTKTSRLIDFSKSAACQTRDTWTSHTLGAQRARNEKIHSRKYTISDVRRNTNALGCEWPSSLRGGALINSTND